MEGFGVGVEIESVAPEGVDNFLGCSGVFEIGGVFVAKAVGTGGTEDDDASRFTWAPATPC